MKITNEQYTLFAGLFHIVIATTYALICISNYSFNWLDYEFAKDLSHTEIFKIKSGRDYDPNLTWGLAGFNGIMFIVYWVIWRENRMVKKPDFTIDTFSIGTIPFLFALFIYYMVDYRNDLVFVITVSYATLNLALYIGHEIGEKQKQQVKGRYEQQDLDGRNHD